jgi:hypothetical protein
MQLSYIGQDTEFFLFNTRSKKPVPAYKYFPPVGKALQCKDTDPGNLPKEKYSEELRTSGAFRGGHGSGKVFRDGYAVEINTSPYLCRAHVWQAMRFMTRWARETAKLPEHIVFTSRPVAEFTPASMSKWPKDMLELGCSPTLDAYEKKQKAIQVDPKKLFWRTSGAHEHFSYPMGQGRNRHLLQDTEHQSNFIKLMDRLVGVPHAFMFASADEFKRRTLYGQAGEFRDQRYPNGGRGIEYRVLSTRIYDHPALAALFFGIPKYVVFPQYEELVQALDPKKDDLVRGAINEGKDLPQAMEEWARVFSFTDGEWNINFPQGDKGLALWEALRKKVQNGDFVDAGVANYPFPEGHTSWGEYRQVWGL